MNGDSTNGAIELTRDLVVVLREDERAGLIPAKCSCPVRQRAARRRALDANRTSCVNCFASSVLSRVASGNGV